MELQILLLVSTFLLVASGYSKHPSIKAYSERMKSRGIGYAGKDLHTQETSHHGGHHKISYHGKLKAKSSKWWDGYVKGWYDGWNQGYNFNKHDDHHGHDEGHHGSYEGEHHIDHHGGHYGHLIGHHGHSGGAIGYAGDAYGHSAHASEQILYADIRHRAHSDDIHGHDIRGSDERLHASEARKHFILNREGHGHDIGNVRRHHILHPDHGIHNTQPIGIAHDALSLTRITHESRPLRTTAH